MESTSAIPSPVTATAHAGINVRKLFVLCCLCLATTSMSFALRTSIAGDLKAELFDPIDPLTSATMVGDVLSCAFLGFAFWVFLGSAFVDCDRHAQHARAVRPQLHRRAVARHRRRSSSSSGAGHGHSGRHRHVRQRVRVGLLGDRSSIPSRRRSTRATRSTASTCCTRGGPFGMIVGGLLGYGAGKIGLGWRVEFGLLLIPAVAILALHVGTKFPKTERVTAGITTTEMYKEALRPGFILWFLAMFLTSASELAPGQWVDLALSNTVGMRGILLQVYVAGLMFVMRHFAGTMVHKLSSVGLLFVSCLLASLGLLALLARELARHGLPHGDDLGHGRLLHVADDAGLGRPSATPRAARSSWASSARPGRCRSISCCRRWARSSTRRRSRPRAARPSYKALSDGRAHGDRQRRRAAVVPRRRHPAGRPARRLRRDLAARSLEGRIQAREDLS